MRREHGNFLYNWIVSEKPPTVPGVSPEWEAAALSQDPQLQLQESWFPG